MIRFGDIDWSMETLRQNLYRDFETELYNFLVGLRFGAILEWIRFY